MTRQELPSPELLRKLLRYEPDTGKLFWKKRTPDIFTNGKQPAAQICAAWNGRYAEKEAFTATDSNGYPHGRIFDRVFSAHRVIWAIVHGSWPKYQIDHINGIRSDNRIINLRAVTNRENGLNQKRHATNSSGISGVSWDKSRAKWMAYIHDVKGFRQLGRFTSKSDAAAARKAAEIELGYHENHGRAELTNPNLQS